MFVTEKIISYEKNLMIINSILSKTPTPQPKLSTYHFLNTKQNSTILPSEDSIEILRKRKRERDV